MKNKMLLAALISVVAFNIPQAHGQETQQAESHGSSGVQHATCLSLQDVKSTHTPIDLTNSAAQCVAEGDYDKAIRLYITARMYTRFDIERVADDTVEDAGTVLTLRMMSSMNESQKKTWEDVQSKLASAPSFRQELCTQMQRIGPPSYYPSYLINHGMNAFLGDTSPAKSLKAGFKADATWKEIEQNSLKCKL